MPMIFNMLHEIMVQQLGGVFFHELDSYFVTNEEQMRTVHSVLEAPHMNNGGTKLIILRLVNPHGLEGGERG